MEREMKLKDWIGKTIQHAEIKGENYLIHFTDGSIVTMKAYIHHVEDGWATPYDWPELDIKYKTNE